MATKRVGFGNGIGEIRLDANVLRYEETLRFASGVLSGVAKLADLMGTAGCILLHQHQSEKPNDLKASLPLSAKLFGQL